VERQSSTPSNNIIKDMKKYIGFKKFKEELESCTKKDILKVFKIIIPNKLKSQIISKINLDFEEKIATFFNDFGNPTMQAQKIIEKILD